MDSEIITVSRLGKQYIRYRGGRPHSLRQLASRLVQNRGARERFWALRDVSFSLRRSEMLGVIGHNGSGKSTLLRLLAGVMRPDEGSVRVRGRIGGLLQLGVGFHPDQSGRENVFTNGIVAGLTRREVAQRFESIVSFAGLENFIDSPLRTYSTGMRMRLGFAIAAHTDPDVLLIDEVLTVGDLAFQRKCLDRIELYKASGCTIVFVTHSLEEVKEHCERALWLRNGEVVAFGNSEVIADQYKEEMLAETRRRSSGASGPKAAPNGVMLLKDVNRFGSREMEIETVRLLDAQEREVTELRSGESLTVEVAYHAPVPIDSPIFSVAISDRKHQDCFDTSTEAEGVLLPRLVGRGKIALRLGRLDLNRGEYFVNVGVYPSDWRYTYDYHWHVYPLNITSGTPSSGILSPPRRWELAIDESLHTVA